MLTLLTALFATTISLPGGPPVGMDYLTFDPSTNRLWVPAGNTGTIDVVDVATGKVESIGGLATAPPRRPDRPRMGPSSATVGEGVVWVGNRGDNQLHGYNARTLAAVGVIQLSSMPDGIAYVKATRELWVTTPRDGTITIAKPAGQALSSLVTIKLEGAPEGYAVDDDRGLFYTNLEDKNRTLAIDVKTRKIVEDWPSGCGAEGPRGLAIDTSHRWLFVACTDGANVADLAHEGRSLGRVTTGGGVDNLDYDRRRRLLFVASSKDGQLAIVHVEDGGAPRRSASVPTAPGARNAVVDAQGTVYVEDSRGAKLIVIRP